MIKDRGKKERRGRGKTPTRLHAGHKYNKTFGLVLRI